MKPENAGSIAGLALQVSVFLSSDNVVYLL